MLGGQPARHTCSRASCRAVAQWEIRWRNPKIHSTDRVKIWLACPDHLEYLRDFLAARDFPIQVVPHERATAGGGADSPPMLD